MMIVSSSLSNPEPLNSDPNSAPFGERAGLLAARKTLNTEGNETAYEEEPRERCHHGAANPEPNFSASALVCSSLPHRIFK